MLIVAAIDGSPTTEFVLAAAVAEAAAHGADLHVVHVFYPPTSLYWIETATLLDETTFGEAACAEVWKRAEAALDGVDVVWDRADLRGHPATEIVAYAADQTAELIIIGNRGRGDFASLMLGSTSHAVIHDAPCDVIVVRGPGAG